MCDRCVVVRSLLENENSVTVLDLALMSPLMPSWLLGQAAVARDPPATRLMPDKALWALSVQFRHGKGKGLDFRRSN
jgi:hypothetical protein